MRKKKTPKVKVLKPGAETTHFQNNSHDKWLPRIKNKQRGLPGRGRINDQIENQINTEELREILG